MYSTLRFDIEDTYDPLRLGADTLGDASVHVEPTIPHGGTMEQFVWAFDDPDGSVGDAFRTADGVTTVESFQSNDDGSDVYRVRWTDQPSGVFACVRAAEGTLLEAVCRYGTWSFLVRLPSSGFGPFQEACSRLGLEATVRSVDSGPPQFRPSGPASAWNQLTATQAEALTLALDAGYFDVPRAVSLNELAAQLGVSDSAVSQRLRRGLSTLLSSADQTVRTAPRQSTD